MATSETAFWGDDLLVIEALTPIAVMRQAAAQLPVKTNNLLEAEIDSSMDEEECVVHTFSIIAPGLDRYACPIFTVGHNEMLVYPTITKRLVFDDDRDDNWSDDTEEGLRATIRGILSLGSVKAIIYSLCARLNEAKVRQASKP